MIRTIRRSVCPEICPPTTARTSRMPVPTRWRCKPCKPMFMHPMHDVTATEQIHGDQVLDALQVELDVLEREMDVGTGERDPNERKSY